MRGRSRQSSGGLLVDGREKGKIMLLGNIQVLAVLLFVAAVLSGITAASAFAGEHEGEGWLVEGKPISEGEGSLAAYAEEELTLEDSKVPLVGKVAVLCKLIADGTVGPEIKDEITEILNSAGEKIGASLAGTALLCVTVTECESSETDIEVWPRDLSWLTELEGIAAESQILDKLIGSSGDEPGWEVKCLIGGLAVEDSCEGPTSAQISEGTSESNLLEEFNSAAPVTCSEGGAESGIIRGGGLILLTSGKALAGLMCPPVEEGLKGEYETALDCWEGKKLGSYVDGYDNVFR